MFRLREERWIGIRGLARRGTGEPTDARRTTS